MSFLEFFLMSNSNKNTQQTERIKSLLAYGRGGVHDPVLALQRDTSSATAAPSRADGSDDGGTQQQIKGLQDTQLSQLEHLIAQQRKAHQRMRHVLREAEKVNCLKAFRKSVNIFNPVIMFIIMRGFLLKNFTYIKCAKFNFVI